MKFLSLIILAIVVSLASCNILNLRRNANKPPKTTTSSANNDHSIHSALLAMSDLGCGLRLDTDSIETKDIFLVDETMFLNISALIYSTDGFVIPATFLITGPIEPGPIPIYSIIFRGDRINSYSYSLPYAEISTNYDSLEQVLQEKNITIEFGWPFNCNDLFPQNLNQSVSLVNYIDNIAQIDEDGYEYVGLAKLKIDDFCINLLLGSDNWLISLYGIRFYTSCSPNDAPYI